MNGAEGVAPLEFAAHDGVERNLREPGPMATEHRAGVGGGRFFEGYCNWRRIPEYRAFVLESPAARIAARPGVASPPFPGIGLADGEPTREDWFPVVWRAEA